MFRSLFFRNWLNDWWLDYIYLRQRTPIACTLVSQPLNMIIIGPALLQSTLTILCWDPKIIKLPHSLTEQPWLSTSEFKVPRNSAKEKIIALWPRLSSPSVWTELGGLGWFGRYSSLPERMTLLSTCRYLSSTSRIPGREIDRISNYDHRQIRHVVVLRWVDYCLAVMLTSNGYLV